MQILDRTRLQQLADRLERVDALLVEIANADTDLRGALEASVQLQSHYAGLLNAWDGGERMVFTDAQAWLERRALLRKAATNGGGEGHDGAIRR